MFVFERYVPKNRPPIAWKPVQREYFIADTSPCRIKQ